MSLFCLLIGIIRSMTTLRMMIRGRTLEVVRLESDEKTCPQPEVSSTLLSLCRQSPFDAFITYPNPSVSKQNTPSAQSPSESESDIDAYGGSRRAAAKKNNRRSVQPIRDTTPAHGEVRFSTRKAARVSNYNEDDDDMFDDEADMVPQEYWTAGPEEDVPAIDAVLNHRLRNDTSQLYGRGVLGLMTNMPIGHEVTDPGRDDFEYYVGINLPTHPALSQYLTSDAQ